MTDSRPTPVVDLDFAPSVREGRLGAYELLAEIGRGGIGVVYRARHVHLGKLVAVKLLRPDSLGGAAEIRRFQREMRSFGAVDSPHVVGARDAGEVNGTYFLVMDLVEGVDLARVVRSRGRLSVADACEVVRQALLGVRDVWSRELVHRDLKPSNLIVDRTGTVRVLDLGLARVERAEDESELTRTGMMMGTAGFVSPEQVRDPRRVDVRADLYSLGCTLFALLTGRLPFDKPEFPTSLDKMLAHVNEEPPRLSQFREVPKELEALVSEALQKDPARRPATPDVFASRLEPFCGNADLASLAGPVVDLEPPLDSAAANAPTRTGHALHESTETRPPSHPTAPPRRSYRLVWTGLAVTLVALLVALVATFLPRPPDEIPFDLDELKAGRWYNLLERDPRELVWPDATRGSWWRTEEDRTLRVDNRVRRALLELGRTRAEAYTFRVHVHQTDWTGDVGLFLGFRPDPEECAGCSRAQFVRLLRYRPPGKPPGFVVERGHLVIRPDEDRGFDVETRGVGSHEIPGVYGEEILEFRVERDRLLAATLGGIELSGLLTGEVNSQFDPDDYQGRLGLFVGRATAEFRRADFYVAAPPSTGNSTEPDP